MTARLFRLVFNESVAYGFNRHTYNSRWVGLTSSLQNRVRFERCHCMRRCEERLTGSAQAGARHAEAARGLAVPLKMPAVLLIPVSLLISCGGSMTARRPTVRSSAHLDPQQPLRSTQRRCPQQAGQPHSRPAGWAAASITTGQLTCRGAHDHTTSKTRHSTGGGRDPILNDRSGLR